MNTSKKNEPPSNTPPEVPSWVELLRAVAPVVQMSADDNDWGVIPDPDNDSVFIVMEPMSEEEGLEIIKKLDEHFGKKNSKPIPLAGKKAGHRRASGANWYQGYLDSYRRPTR